MKNVLISLERLSQFWTKVKEFFNPKLEKLDKKTWKGTQAEFATALSQGLIDETTVIVITDADEPVVYCFCSSSDIQALFPQYM